MTPLLYRYLSNLPSTTSKLLAGPITLFVRRFNPFRLTVHETIDYKPSIFCLRCAACRMFRTYSFKKISLWPLKHVSDALKYAAPSLMLPPSATLDISPCLLVQQGTSTPRRMSLRRRILWVIQMCATFEDCSMIPGAQPRKSYIISAPTINTMFGTDITCEHDAILRAFHILASTATSSPSSPSSTDMVHRYLNLHSFGNNWCPLILVCYVAFDDISVSFRHHMCRLSLLIIVVYKYSLDHVFSLFFSPKSNMFNLA